MSQLKMTEMFQRKKNNSRLQWNNRALPELT